MNLSFYENAAIQRENKQFIRADWILIYQPHILCQKSFRFRARKSKSGKVWSIE